MADEVVLTIGQAFEVAYQKMMKARAKLTASAFEKTLEQVQYCIIMIYCVSCDLCRIQPLPLL